MPNATKTKEGNASKDKIHVRMYRQGLGDCFLVRFPKDNGSGSFNILIDCGLIAVANDPKPIMQKIVADIAKTCHNQVDLVIMTHEHWDHASGFSTFQAQDAFDKIDINEVWYAWTEDPTNALGKKLRAERAAKVNALQVAALALRGVGTPLGMRRAERVESILGFFGVGSPADLAAVGKSGALGKTRGAFEYLAERRGVKVRYCYPKKPPIALPGVGSVRVYVLGPPEDESLIKRSSPTKKGKEVYEFAADLAMDDNLAAAFGRVTKSPDAPGGVDCPFESGLCVPDDKGSQKLEKLKADTWDKAEFNWRRIDFDWMASAETVALNLDSHTNNTCLVIAFELVKSGRVLLFPADAQVGNWLSWQATKWQVNEGHETRTVTGPDLLQRTMFYKVGHHGSHNATLKTLGLEQMTSDDLIAFVPVFKAQAMKNRWREMPFEPLVKRLNEKTGGRLVFSDPMKPAPSAISLDSLASVQTNEFLTGLTIETLYYEYSFSL